MKERKQNKTPKVGQREYYDLLSPQTDHTTDLFEKIPESKEKAVPAQKKVNLTILQALEDSNFA